MKLNKYLLGLAVVAMGGLTACNTDVEGEYYPYSTDYAHNYDPTGSGDGRISVGKNRMDIDAV